MATVLRAALILSLVLTFTNGGSALIEDAIEVLKLGKDVIKEVFNSWELVHKSLDVTPGVDLPVMRQMERKLLSRLDGVERKIGKLDLEIDKSTTATISFLMSRIPQNTRLELRLHELTDLIARVNNAERQMKSYVENRDTIEKLTLENFAVWAVSHQPEALPGMLERIHALMAPKTLNILFEGGVLKLIVNNYKDAESLCNLQQSPHQLLYNMYSTISLTEIKGYAMMQFSWMLLKIYGNGNFTQEANLMRKRFDERTSLTVASVRSAMSEATREMWRCDPLFHEEEKTYTQVTQLLQGYIENEVDMNSDGTCRENCAFYTLAENKGCFKDQYCSRQAKCTGKIINCQYIDSDMWICPATRNSGRRYEWIEYENGRTLGRPGSCLRGYSKVDSWWRWNLFHCSYCMCLCDQTGPLSDRYFSMRNVVANTALNKVVTGLRFVKINRIIYLQIHEGVILPRGNIDQTTTSWVQVHRMDVEKNKTLVNGVDYHTMTYEERGMDLDDLQGADGHVMTGVRFQKVGAHLHFEIQITPYNYTTGRLNAMKSRWESNDNTEAADKPRTRLTLVNPDIPIHSTSPSKPDSKNDQFLEFTHSGFDADAAQTTVPFIDIQPVIPVTTVALTGAGIYHKGQKGYGGFVAPKIFTYDYVKHMKAEFPEIESDYNIV